MQSNKERKELLREQFRKIRGDMDAGTRTRHSKNVCSRIFELLQARSAETIHLYWPLIERGELDTRPLIMVLQDQHYRIVLPRVLQKDAEPASEPLMSHHLFTGPDSLTTNRWGILEPADSPEISSEEIDVVVVPALGAGRNRHRIGHGRGYYDTFLAGIAAHTICAVYDECLVDTVPTEPHDIPLDVIITPTKKISAPT